MHEPNPYAPPRDVAPPPVVGPPLPAGVQRYGLDAAKLRAYLAKVWRAVVVRVVVFLLIWTALQYALGLLTIETLIVLVPVMGVYLVVATVVQKWRVGRSFERIHRGYELLASPRALRRTAFGAVPAEMLAPEVTSIVEIPDGLSIDARGVRQRLFVVRAIDRYEEVRDHVARWAPIETKRGFAAWARKWSHRMGEKPRDRIDGTALASDPSLGGELAAVRALAMPFDPRAVRRPWRRVLIAWLILIAMFLAIWQFLSPARRTPARPHRSVPGYEE